MENLILSFEVVFPLFAVMALGYLIRRLNLFGDETVRQMNNVVFRFFLPVLLFRNVYNTNLSGTFNPKLTAFAVISVLCSFVLAFGAVMLLEKDNRKRGVLIQGIFRSNFIIFGIPVTISLFGDKSAGIASLLIAFIIPIFNLLAVLVLEIFRGGKVNFKKVLKGIVTNPLIIASLLAVLFLASSIRIPPIISGIIDDIGGVATPLALFLLGASFTFSKMKGRGKQLMIGIGGKLVAVPLIFLTIGILLGFRGAELVVLLALFGSPAAVSSFIMAQQMDGDGDLAGQLVVLGSLCSIITMFIWIFILKQAAFI